MTTPAENEHKVRQLDSDVLSIYEMLTELGNGVKKVQAVQLRQGSRLDHIEDRLTGVDGRLTGVEDRLIGVDGKLDVILDLLRGDQSTDTQ